MPKVIDKILRMGEGKVLKQLEAIAKQVNAIEDEFRAMSDDELRGMTDEFRDRLANGESLDDIMPEAFATVREAAFRVLGQRHFDVQIMGGAALHLGNIAEMKTGEGKTLVSTLPAYLNALSGKGVHIVTVNDYLAKYHAEWMGRVHHFLGLTVGQILPSMPPSERRESYAADITYGTNNEFGFDYLRDNMADDIADCVQRGHNFAVVDEVDSILIDEARTPLIISGPTEEEVKWYGEFAKIVGAMQPDVHYEVDEKKRTISVTEEGIDRVEDQLGIDNLYDAVNTPLISFLNNAIKAKELFKNDKDYVVIDGDVLIVDEHTGRILDGRRYNEGLHQAIEAKEGVRIREEYQTLATITLQNYFRLYDKLGGMTGTALTEASEFDKIYKLGVVPIPTNRPIKRLDQPDLVYRTEQAKFDAVVEDIVERHASGQPILVGTTSVEKSERLSKQLTKRGVPHEVLNAKQHDREAAIVAMAGHKGAVTVATNMAGRGTDIMLGGSVEFLADQALRKKGLDPLEDSEAYEAAWPATLKQMEEQVAAEHDEVARAGGLAVIGTERHESRRIDNQLRGRSGRQGDPGETRFYLSLEDDLMRLFKADWVNWVLQTMKIPDDVPIENKRVTGAIASAQSQVEAQNFDSRKNILKYDDVMSRQREVIYGERRRVLEGEDMHEWVTSMIGEVTGAYVTGATEGFPEEWELQQLWTALGTLYPVGLTIEQVEAEAGGREGLSRELLKQKVEQDALQAYGNREAELGSEVMLELERRVVLSVLDR
ncbi:MAG: preprotein translocase subunit SecA, partial [Aeromicrobium sp.]|nr:preprotein translocase subunit SecA [Aeromicrobium sp.]